MFNAQLIYGNSGDGTELFSPWFPRGGDNLRATLEVIDIQGGGSKSLKVEVFHKNSEDTGNGDNADGTKSINLAIKGTSTTEWTGLKELVRYKFTMKNATTDLAIFRMLAPVWFDAVNAA